MYCPHCRTEYREGFFECADCHIPLVNVLPETEEVEEVVEAYQEPLPNLDLDVMIETGLHDPVAIGLARSLLEEAGIPFYSHDGDVYKRGDNEGLSGLWTVWLPHENENEAREIIRTVEETR